MVSVHSTFCCPIRITTRDLVPTCPCTPLSGSCSTRPRSHFGRCAGSASSWTTRSRGNAISIEMVYFMVVRSGIPSERANASILASYRACPNLVSAGELGLTTALLRSEQCATGGRCHWLAWSTAEVVGEYPPAFRLGVGAFTDHAQTGQDVDGAGP